MEVRSLGPSVCPVSETQLGTEKGPRPEAGSIWKSGTQSEQLAPSWGDRVSDSVLGGGEGQASRAAGAQKPPGGWHALGFLSDGQALPQKPLLVAQLMPGFLQNERARQ